MPPALLQPALLDFNLVSAIHDIIDFGPAHPDADPIAGWVIPNHLDGSLMAYDGQGDLLGEMSIGVSVSGQPTVFWAPAPNSPYSTLQQIDAAVPHFGAFLLALSQQSPAAVTAFLDAIDETLWTTVPMGAVFDHSLAILVGRPLAMVRARLQFLLEGAPYSDPSWDNTFDGSNCTKLAPPGSPLSGYKFGIELGNVAQLDDGLIGYFTNDNYATFNVVTESGASADGYLSPIGVDDNYIYLKFDGKAEYVSMLVDPRAQVHATTAILPDVTVTLPPNFVADALACMNITFRMDGVMTDQQLDAAGPSLPTVLMPVPRVKSGDWSWLENDDSGWLTYATGPTDTAARLTEVAPVLRRGMLQLSSALANDASRTNVKPIHPNLTMEDKK